MNGTLIVLLLFFVPLLSGIAIILFKPLLGSKVKWLLSFSAAFLLSICFTHLLPEVFEAGPVIGYYLLAGFFIQILLEFFSAGIEHGHVHHSKNATFPFLVFLSLCLHAFIEGFPLAGYVSPVHAMDNYSQALLTGILLHKIPIALVLASLLIGKKIKTWKIITALVIFASTAPLSILSVVYFRENFEWMNIQYLTAISVGIFLHISTVILFESSKEHQFNLIKFVSIILGVALALLTFGIHA